MAERRVTAGWGLEVDAQKVVDEFGARKGMTKQEIVTRIMAWFARQPATVQSVIVGLVDEGMESAYANALRGIADGIEREAAKPNGPPRNVVIVGEEGEHADDAKPEYGQEPESGEPAPGRSAAKPPAPAPPSARRRAGPR